MSDKLLDTIEAVHAAGLEAELWPDALRRIAGLFGAVGASLEIFDKRTRTLKELQTVGLPEGAELPYVEHYANCNSRASYAMRNLSQRILFDYRLTDERSMDRDPFYMEYLRSIGLRYFVTGQIVDTADTHGIVSVQRSRRQGHVERRHLDWMRRLRPHLCQAHDTSTRVGSAIAANRSLEQALDWLADGVVLVRADGTVTFANRAMREIARRNDGIAILRGALDFAAPDARTRFDAAAAAVLQFDGDASGAASTDFAVPRPAGKPPYLVSVRPLGRKDRGTAHAIVFVRDPLSRNGAAAQLLKGLFGLTDAEANLAHALHSGTTLAEYARTRMLSLNTVYTHLRRIREKTNTKRQAELIRKLNDFHPPLRTE
jgi:DNA-binding CsgD family transcriptional regulator/PAS domain-containing protein